MIWLILIYFAVGIIRAVNILKRPSFERPSLANENQVAFVLYEQFLWPISFAIQLYLEHLLNNTKK